MHKIVSIKRLGLFLPAMNSFYLSLFFALKRAFNELDIEVSGWTSLPSEKELEVFIDQFKPDAIFEMNRSRRQVPSLPRKVKHISWMVDVADFLKNQLCS